MCYNKSVSQAGLVKQCMLEGSHPKVVCEGLTYPRVACCFGGIVKVWRNLVYGPERCTALLYGLEMPRVEIVRK